MAWFPFRFRPWRAPVTKLANLPIIVYTRRGCHLCEDAERLLQAEQRRYHFELALVNIDTDPLLASQYGDAVPVVTVNGKVRFRGGVNRVLLERLLVAEGRAAEASRRGRS